jgi:hypothetical protein
MENCEYDRIFLEVLIGCPEENEVPFPPIRLLRHLEAYDQAAAMQGV